ncbi:hypothetical protein Syun_000431 [Stephania yunnanensis]|uniref:Uncharacterized protein n=1 Tax=Stephania yunnanensis TaxID=152371 RepID=A0AAP0LC46_9MAGN
MRGQSTHVRVTGGRSAGMEKVDRVGLLWSGCPFSPMDKSERDMRDLEELLSKLNPMARNSCRHRWLAMDRKSGFSPTTSLCLAMATALPTEILGRRKKNGFNQGKRRMNSRTSMAQRDEIIRRTVYVSDIDHQVNGRFGFYTIEVLDYLPYN